MTEQAQEQTIKVDDKVYKVSDLSEEAGSQVRALQIADQVVAQQQAQFEIARIGRDTIIGATQRVTEGCSLCRSTQIRRKGRRLIDGKSVRIKGNQSSINTE